MKILFVDPCCPKPYTVASLDEGGMGGTEATCARLMRELSKRDSVAIAQLKREEEETDANGIRYILFDTLLDSPDVVITLRDGKIFRVMNDRYPSARHLLWMHDIVAGPYKEHLAQTIGGFPTTLVTGSFWHKMQIVGEFPDEFVSRKWTCDIITNFVEHYCIRRPVEVDPYQLIFFSSPHKGLPKVLELFTALRLKDSRYRLKVSNPGYFKSAENLPEGVESLGILKHAEVMDHVSKSLCTFYPNMSFPETFGLVYAESNAVGTPVLCHDIGAAKEIISTQQQMVDCANTELVCKTIQDWTNGLRPIVKVKEQYTIREAIREWRKYLNPMRRIR